MLTAEVSCSAECSYSYGNAPKAIMPESAGHTPKRAIERSSTLLAVQSSIDDTDHLIHRKGASQELIDVLSVRSRILHDLVVADVEDVDVRLCREPRVDLGHVFFKHCSHFVVRHLIGGL